LHGRRPVRRLGDLSIASLSSFRGSVSAFDANDGSYAQTGAMLLIAVDRIGALLFRETRVRAHA
jgi:hypothetical protein